jgi:transposase
LLQRNEATISRWLLKYRCGGLAKLPEVKRAPGNPVKIPPAAVAQLRQRLSQPEGFHRYGEAQKWLEQVCGVKAAYKTVHKLVRYKLLFDTKSATSTQYQATSASLRAV